MLSPAAACVRRNHATHDSWGGAAQRSEATPPQNAASRPGPCKLESLLSKVERDFRMSITRKFIFVIIFEMPPQA
ncbi:hypothetical protein L596_009517 [Steinernema carpocapsae]|uniref:Uncharacterized protein n=1 Tax=Steinernema carpocapsae TaxID=34508 RepID=A0A4U5PG39_STECR|nr:hypothetical protein L596_009517 [Steinernema carpocapsae]